MNMDFNSCQNSISPSTLRNATFVFDTYLQEHEPCPPSEGIRLSQFLFIFSKWKFDSFFEEIFQ